MIETATSIFLDKETKEEVDGSGSPRRRTAS